MFVAKSLYAYQAMNSEVFMSPTRNHIRIDVAVGCVDRSRPLTATETNLLQIRAKEQSFGRDWF